MLKRMSLLFSVLLVSALVTGAWAAPAPAPVTAPNVTFTLVQGLPAAMRVGQTGTVIVQIESDQPFIFAQMLPSFYFPGRAIKAVQMGGVRTGKGTSATLAITFVATASTAGFPGGVAPVTVVPGAHFMGGYTASERFSFNVAVP